MLKNSQANVIDAKRLGQSSTSTIDEKQEPEQVFSQTEQQQKKLHHNYTSAMVQPILYCIPSLGSTSFRKVGAKPPDRRAQPQVHVVQSFVTVQP